MALDVGLISGDAVFHNVPGLVVHEPRRDDRALQYVSLRVTCVAAAAVPAGIADVRSILTDAGARQRALPKP